MFPPGEAAQGSARLCALGISALLLLFPLGLLCAARPEMPAAAAARPAHIRAAYRIISLLLSICFAARCSYMLTLYAGMIELYLLPRTPAFVVIAALLLTAFIIARSDTARLPGIAGIVIMCASLPAAALFAAGLYRSDPGEWLILLQPDRRDIPGLIVPCLMCCSGFECSFFFVGDASRRGARRAVIAGFCVTCALAALSYMLCAGMLTVQGCGHLNYPLVETARVINIGGVAFTERFDLLLMVISIALLPAHTGIELHCAGECVRTALGRDDIRPARLLMLLTGAAAWLGQYAQFNRVLRTAAMICYVFTAFAGIPALCLIGRAGTGKRSGNIPEDERSAGHE